MHAAAAGTGLSELVRCLGTVDWGLGAMCVSSVDIVDMGARGRMVAGCPAQPVAALFSLMRLRGEKRTAAFVKTFGGPSLGSGVGVVAVGAWHDANVFSSGLPAILCACGLMCVWIGV